MDNKDYVVSYYTGGYTSNRCRHDYIVTAKNKTEAKRMIKNRNYNAKGVTASLVSEYKYYLIYIIYYNSSYQFLFFFELFFHK